MKLQRVDLKGKASARGSRGALERGQSSSLPAPEKVGRIIARASRDRSAAADDDDPQPSSADEADEEEGEGDEAAERSVLRSLKRSKSGKPVDMDVSKKKWYELIALIKVSHAPQSPHHPCHPLLPPTQHVVLPPCGALIANSTQRMLQQISGWVWRVCFSMIYKENMRSFIYYFHFF